MRRNMRNLVWAGVAVGFLTGVANIWAETWTLELKRMETFDPSKGYSTQTDYLYRATSPQGFFRQAVPDGKGGTRLVGNDQQEARFKKIVKKEPKYNSAHPFRGVAKLGTQEFAFVLDSSEPEPKEKAKNEEKVAKAEPKDGSATAKTVSSMPAFDRLYFDFNHNGDLTDDKVIVGKAQTNQGQYMSGNAVNSITFTSVTFPRLDITIDADGTTIDSAIVLSANSQMSRDFNYTSVQINAAAYRTGEITLEGKKHHVVLIDFNSNGRFDDAMKIRTDVHGSGGQIYPEQGDMLLIDPEKNIGKRQFDSPYDATSADYRHNVSKLICIDGRYYDMKITPAGDKLTLEPSSVAFGHVTNPNDNFHAMIYSDAGFLKISGKKNTPIPVPEGQWKLLSYTIQTEPPKPAEPAKKEIKKDAKQLSLLDLLKNAFGANPDVDVVSSNRPSMVAAQATDQYKAVKVVKGETVVLPFGPPYKPVVTAQNYGNPKEVNPELLQIVNLEMSLVGSAGEICTNLMCGNGRPGKPEFTITDPKGKVVQQGSFEYG